MKRPVQIITTLVFLIIALGVVRVTVSNGLSTSGIAVKSIEDNVSSFKKENLILQEQLLSISSYTEIASKAGELGFVPDKTNLVISTSLPIALKQ
jgi:cell division protein FtsL